MYRSKEYPAAINAMMLSGIKEKVEKDKELAIRSTSLARFKEGGAAILQAEKQNHQKVIEGNKANNPLVTYILRDCVVSYLILANENIQEEHRPWATSIERPPCHPQEVPVIMPAVASPIWLTEEYAIRDFTSVCRTQINLVIAPPTMQIVNIKELTSLFMAIIFLVMRRSPYVPSFKRIPARIMDPATGASTWALGSHR